MNGFNSSINLAKSFEGDLLRAVAPGFGRIGMHFDQQGVGAHGHRAFAHGHHQIGAARALARDQSRSASAIPS